MRGKSEEALRAATALLDSIEAELGAARAALAEAQSALTVSEPALPPAAHTTEQVALLLGLSRSTVAQLIKSGAIPSIKIGGSRRVLSADLDRYLVSLRVAS